MERPEEGRGGAGADAASGSAGVARAQFTVQEFRALHSADRDAALVRVHAEATNVVRSSSRRLAISSPDAEDLVADLVAEAALVTPTWLVRAPATTALGAWLAGVLQVRWRARRRETTRDRAMLREAAGGLARECSSEADELREQASSSRWTDCDELRRLLVVLPFRQRTAIGLRLERHTYAEIGRIMRVRRDTAAGLVKKAKLNLGKLSAGQSVSPELCAVPRLSADAHALLAPDQSRLYSMAAAGKTRSQMADALRCTPNSIKLRLFRLRSSVERIVARSRPAPPTPTTCDLIVEVPTVAHRPGVRP